MRSSVHILVVSALAVAICILATGFSAGARSGAIGVGAVEKAFGSVGITLTLQPVANGVHILNNILHPIPSAKYGVQVNVYRSTSAAQSDFAKFSGKWSYAGYPALRKDNVIVLASPWGHNIGVKSPPVAMPKLVSRAISLLR